MILGELELVVVALPDPTEMSGAVGSTEPIG